MIHQCWVFITLFFSTLDFDFLVCQFDLPDLSHHCSRGRSFCIRHVQHVCFYTIYLIRALYMAQLSSFLDTSVPYLIFIIYYHPFYSILSHLVSSKKNAKQYIDHVTPSPRIPLPCQELDSHIITTSTSIMFKKEWVKPFNPITAIPQLGQQLVRNLLPVKWEHTSSSVWGTAKTAAAVQQSRSRYK